MLHSAILFFAAICFLSSLLTLGVFLLCIVGTINEWFHDRYSEMTRLDGPYGE